LSPRCTVPLQVYRNFSNKKSNVMDNNVFTETTNTSWFSRIGNSIKGLLFGGIFILLSIGFLWWNEGRNV